MAGDISTIVAVFGAAASNAGAEQSGGSSIYISSAQIAIAIAGLAVAGIFNYINRRLSLRVERSQAYLQLEMNSSAVFKYEAENSEKLSYYRHFMEGTERSGASESNAQFAYNLYYQTLNLFEVCARFRQQGIIQPEVFASWVNWFYDTLDDWYFRACWHDIRRNYTHHVRDIFDMGWVIFRDHPDNDPADDAERRRLFWEMVAGVMDCKEIRAWLNETATMVSAPRPPFRWAPFPSLGRKRRPTAPRLDASLLAP